MEEGGVITVSPTIRQIRTPNGDHPSNKITDENVEYNLYLLDRIAPNLADNLKQQFNKKFSNTYLLGNQMAPIKRRSHDAQEKIIQRSEKDG